MQEAVNVTTNTPCRNCGGHEHLVTVEACMLEEGHRYAFTGPARVKVEKLDIVITCCECDLKRNGFMALADMQFLEP